MDISCLGLSPEFRANDVELTVYARGGCKLLFAANLTDRPVNSQIRFDGHKEFVSKWLENGTPSRVEESFPICLLEKSISIWEVRPCD